jgi:hypothetical protein
MKIITSPNDAMQAHMDAREGMTQHFNIELEKILNANSHKDKYWILGKAKTHRRGDKYIVRPFLQACDEKPGLIRESFVYEVDNRRGVKTLLWVMHPDDTLTFPSLGKSIRAAGGKKSGSQILLPE